MELSKATEITAEFPRSVTNENLKIYASLKQCMQNCNDLRMALLEAAEVIERQTELIEHLKGCIDAGKSSAYYG